jgi:glutamate racemase
MCGIRIKILDFFLIFDAGMIGVYDSGVGGLSVWKELRAVMPAEEFCYVSDGAYCPYGPKDPGFVVERATAVSKFLIGRGAETIVVACNTATAAAISSLREQFEIPFVGMEPALKPAALHSKSGVVGVLATAGTFKGRLYLNTLARFSGSVTVIERVGTGLVELVESGDFDGPEAEALVRRYVEPMLEAGADHIVLGCTHYPFLTDTIARIVQGRAAIVNPAPAVAQQARRVVSALREEHPEKEQPAGNPGLSTFFSTGSDETLQKLVRQIAGADADGYLYHSLYII